MNDPGIRAFAGEVRSVLQAAREELSRGAVGHVLVTGVLADQLAKELRSGAEPGAVIVGSTSLDPTVEVVVRVIAGEPTEEDTALVTDADLHGIPVVLVQLWPQAEWTQPWVLSPFVVECRAGEGFPLDEIGVRVLEASERDSVLASRIPVLRRPFERLVVSRSVVRAAVLAAVAGRRAARPALSLEQVRVAARLAVAQRALANGRVSPLQAVGGAAGAALASGFVFRALARTAQRALPAPLANVAVSAAGTWAIATAAAALAKRASS